MWSTCSVAKLRSILDICNGNLHTCSQCVTGVSRVTSRVTQRVTCNVLIFRIKSADSNLLRDSNQWVDGYCGYSDILQCCRYWPPHAAHCTALCSSAAADDVSISFYIHLGNFHFCTDFHKYLQGRSIITAFVVAKSKHRTKMNKKGNLPAKIYNCNLCAHTSNNYHHLKRHEKRHIDIFKCNYCPKTCSSQVNLKNHIIRIHNEGYIPKQRPPS